MATISFTLNDTLVNIDVEPQTSLLEVLRNDFELNGPKFGCGLAQCGACAVQLNGASIRACVTPVAVIEDQKITTLEGLGTENSPHPLQSAFIQHQAMQCGYCASGIIITAAAMLKTNPSATLDQIKIGLSGHLCRCGAQPRMLKAVAQVVDNTREAKS
ncbi:UNVERIFIED_CONTAM: hypothetical protein GTU68_035703 [Idotea baltica]|nr:hypothetical protein [Idotea baltica]